MFKRTSFISSWDSFENSCIVFSFFMRSKRWEKNLKTSFVFGEFERTEKELNFLIVLNSFSFSLFTSISPSSFNFLKIFGQGSLINNLESKSKLISKKKKKN